jgi:hypothetical protein
VIGALDSPLLSKVDTERLLAKVSASRLNCFHTCRLRFYFRYVLGLVKEATGALHVGKSVHWALQQWSKARWYGRPLDTESLADLWAEWRTEAERRARAVLNGGNAESKVAANSLLALVAALAVYVAGAT